MAANMYRVGGMYVNVDLFPIKLGSLLAAHPSRALRSPFVTAACPLARYS